MCWVPELSTVQGYIVKVTIIAYSILPCVALSPHFSKIRLNLTLLSVVIVATCVGFLSLALYKVTLSRYSQVLLQHLNISLDIIDIYRLTPNAQHQHQHHAWCMHNLQLYRSSNLTIGLPLVHCRSIIYYHYHYHYHYHLSSPSSLSLPGCGQSYFAKFKCWGAVITLDSMLRDREC